MKCWVCTRQARGYIHTDEQHPLHDPRRYPVDWAFCSRRCQNSFHQLYGAWRKELQKGSRLEDAMIDVTALEQAAMQACLKPFGEAAGQIGFDKPLGAYSQEQALFVIEVIVTAYVDEMAAQHEATKYPAVRVPAGEVVHDPMRAESTQATAPDSDNPFADLQNDLPWAKPVEGKP